MQRHLAFAALATSLLIGWLAYSPGLHGTFLFDDFNNLAQLGAYGRVDNFRSLILYLSSGSADPIGRPLSLLSFLIDADHWPADPESFKRTNILLHLLNGLLLYWTLLKLGRRLGIEEQRRQPAAVLGAALWLLHPLLVSTTLYVIQREAMLPAAFTLIGMLLWLSGKDRWAQGKWGGLPLLIIGAWGCTGLAMLCKANGVLLPLMLLTMEWTLPDRSNPGGDSRRFRMARNILLGIPSAFLILWLLTKLPGVFRGDTYSRPWTIGQRLLTEPRIICDYLLQLWVPRATGTSVFNDGYSASTGWLHPWTTLPCLMAVLLLLTAGFMQRQRQPALAFAILFYFAGHVLESTVIPLELYFEHRNYLPAMMMFWPLALWLTGPGPLPYLRFALSALLPLILALLCHARAGIWGKPYEQAELLANLAPTSPRAQANAASYEAHEGRPDLAIHRLKSALAQMPDEAQLSLNLIDIECLLGAVTPQTMEMAKFSLTHNRQQAELVQNWLVQKINDVSEKRCAGLDIPALNSLIQAFKDNPYFSQAAGRQLDLLQLQGRVALVQKDADGALNDFNAGLAAFPKPDGALVQAALLGEAGFPRQGLEHLEYYKTLKPADRGLSGMAALHLKLLDHEHYWDTEFDAMARQLREDSAAQAAAPTKVGR